MGISKTLWVFWKITLDRQFSFAVCALLISCALADIAAALPLDVRRWLCPAETGFRFSGYARA
jgi:hypothetical protein